MLNNDEGGSMARPIKYNAVIRARVAALVTEHGAMEAQRRLHTCEDTKDISYPTIRNIASKAGVLLSRGPRRKRPPRISAKEYKASLQEDDFPWF